jgi:hypothetical protein
MFLDQGFELMKNSKIRYFKLVSVNIYCISVTVVVIILKKLFYNK